MFVDETGIHKSVDVIYTKKKGESPRYVVRVNGLFYYFYLNNDNEEVLFEPSWVKAFTRIESATGLANRRSNSWNNVRNDKSMRKVIYTVGKDEPKDE